MEKEDFIPVILVSFFLEACTYVVVLCNRIGEL